jgi:hypothetical protein
MHFVLCLITSLNLFIQPEWTWSIHPESNFKVLTPAPLVHEIREVPTEMDVIRFHQYHVGSVADSLTSLAFVIDHYILPSVDPVSDDAYVSEFFENTIDEMLTTLDGVLVYMDIIHQPGREVCIWKGSYDKGKGVIRGNLILYGDAYYGLQVFGLEKNKPDVLMSKFLDSFKHTTGTSP